MDIQELLARTLPDDLSLAPVEPLLQRGRRAQRLRRYRNAALASVIAVALAGAVALTAMARAAHPTPPGHPQPTVSCATTSGGAAGKPPDNTGGKVDCPPTKPPRSSPETP